MIETRILEAIFRAHCRDMMRLATALLDDADDAEDVVQDVFARLSEKDMAVSEDKTAAYLMTAVRNGCYNIIRRKHFSNNFSPCLYIYNNVFFCFFLFKSSFFVFFLFFLNFSLKKFCCYSFSFYLCTRF
ncbi:MAG: sigma factor [Prevotella sp.]|uniref:sigma factor n=1 Tax=Prevotella sp. TaxID=59823 RepID=UPI002A80CFC7|nr:sigma factor [Prevotella sp.]MDY4020325.1 sigma factor [Prevotella sp.]